MRAVHIPTYNAFIRCHETPSNGPVVVYLPAISFSATASFFGVVTHPKTPDHCALLVDYLGSGMSDHPVNFDYSLDAHARTIAALLDSAGCQKATVIGHSMGGTVAIKLAVLRPDLVGNLIVGEGNVTSGGGSLVKQIVGYEEAEFKDSVFPQMQAEMVEAAKRGDAVGSRRNNVWKGASALGLYRNAHALNGVQDTLLEEFLSLTIPRTFIYGKKSMPATPEAAGPDTPWPDDLRAKGVRIEVVPNAGHGQMFDNLDGFVDVLVRTAFR
ncbi:MAG: alpha/beta hydrolase [Pseudomonadota bacterium]